jgi:hypothetical protein
MKFNKKFFLILALVALVAGLLPTAAFASGIKTRGFVQIDKYSVLSTQPMTLEFKGHLACQKVDISTSVVGKTIYVTLTDAKDVSSGIRCADIQNKGFGRQVSLGVLVPGNYTVYVNMDSNGRWQKKLKLVAPMLPTATPAASSPAPANP